MCALIRAGFGFKFQSQMVFVTHVTMDESVKKNLEFDPPVSAISSAWVKFCDMLAESAFRSLQSSSTVFDFIRLYHQQQSLLPGTSFLDGLTTSRPSDRQKQFIKVAFERK